MDTNVFSQISLSLKSKFNKNIYIGYKVRRLLSEDLKRFNPIYYQRLIVIFMIFRILSRITNGQHQFQNHQ